MNKYEQMAAFDAHSRQSTFALMALLNRNKDEIVRLSRERAFTVGLTEYGDKSWHLGLERLKIETLEELADAVLYQSIYRWKTNGRK